MKARTIASAVVFGMTLAAGAPARAVTVTATAPPTAVKHQPPLRMREAAFLRTVDRQKTAYVVTGDLVHYAGTHVAYTCDVDKIVRPGLILGQCGSEQEPMDLFVHVPTGRLREGERLRILGVMEQPAMWTDITGHTVYYAFMRAVFVNPNV